MKWKPKLIIASAILIAAITMRVFGVNTFVEALGYMAAGYIFGTLPTPEK